MSDQGEKGEGGVCPHSGNGICKVRKIMLPLGKWLALAIALSQDASEVVVRGENEALDLMHSGPYEAPFFTFLPKKSLSQCLLLPPNFFLFS